MISLSTFVFLQQKITEKSSFDSDIPSILCPFWFNTFSLILPLPYRIDGPALWFLRFKIPHHKVEHQSNKTRKWRSARCNTVKIQKQTEDTVAKTSVFKCNLGTHNSFKSHLHLGIESFNCLLMYWSWIDKQVEKFWFFLHSKCFFFCQVVQFKFQIQRLRGPWRFIINDFMRQIYRY